MEKKFFTVGETAVGFRLDKFLAQKNEQMSRSYIQKLINDGNVTVNNDKVKNSYQLKMVDQIVVNIPEAIELDLKPLEIDLNIIYEDDDIIVINKPAGLIVHPVPGNRDRTLVNALLAHTNQLSGINGVKRPGIVHRLDKDTSGALVVAKNDESHKQLVKQFKQRKIKKIYRTIVKGDLTYEQGKIDAPIGRNPKHRKKMAVTSQNSKNAITNFIVLEQLQGYTYLEVKLETGRTHQIRVHFSYLGHPVLGDDKYGRKNNKPGVKRQMLHAFNLGLNHPITGEWQEFTAPLPVDFQTVLADLRKSS